MFWSKIGSNVHPVVFKQEGGRVLVDFKQVVVEFHDVLSMTDIACWCKSSPRSGFLDSDSIPDKSIVSH